VNQTWLVTAFFFALFSLILYGAFLILTPFLTAITWAVILAILVYPLYAWLLQLLRGRATLAAITVIAVITLIVIAPGVELARFLTEEAILLVQSVRALLEEDGKQEWLAKPWVQVLVSWWELVSFHLMGFNIDINWKEMLVQGAQNSSKALVERVTGIAQNVLLFTVNFLIALITLFFLLRDGKEFLTGSSACCRWIGSTSSACSRISSMPFWLSCTARSSWGWCRAFSPDSRIIF
jgi:predicted PurR-regulated permease PerM